MQQDSAFEKLRFRHSEKLSEKVFEMMDGGALIYPQEGLKQADFIIREIARATSFSEEAFQEALYRNHRYRLTDWTQCREDLENFRLDGKRIEIGSKHPWKLSAGRRKAIDALYCDFSIERKYGIRCLYRQKIPNPNPMFEPWMLPDKESGEGVKDFRTRTQVNCGMSIVERDMFNLLHTVMMAKLPDF